MFKVPRLIAMAGLLCLALNFGLSEPAQAASATIQWDAPGPAQLPADFDRIEILRALQTCTAQGPFAPLVINGQAVIIRKPTTGAFPTMFVDTTVPPIDGQICYVLRSYDLTGNSAVSNIAVKVLNLDPPGAFQNLQVPTVTP